MWYPNLYSLYPELPFTPPPYSPRGRAMAGGLLSNAEPTPSYDQLPNYNGWGAI